MALSTYFPFANITQTSTRLVMAADIGNTERFVLTGSGFKYDDRGVLLSGRITGLKYYIGSALDQSITITGYDAARLFSNVLSKADGLLTQIESWSLADMDATPSVTTKRILFACSDGTSLQLLGSFSPDDPDIGTVTAVRHVSISGAVLHQASGLPLPTKLAMTAILPSTVIFDAVMSGFNIVRATKNANTHFLDGGLGNDLLIGSTLSARDFAEYTDSKAAVFVSLAAGLSFGGLGSDKLYYIEGVMATRFSDTIYGSGASNVVYAFAGHDRIYTSGANDQVYGGEGSDIIDGGANDDILFGDGQNDVLYGRSGSDHLDGGEGHDVLFGGLGGDILKGGAGQDLLVFDTLPSSLDDVDGIFDFSTSEDTIALEDAVFTALGTPAPGGLLAESAFWSNDTGAAHDADDRIIVRIFGSSVGFYYDPDGTGDAPGLYIAGFTVGLTGALSNADFKIV